MTPYHWLTAEDVIRHALAAYYACCRDADHDMRAFPSMRECEPSVLFTGFRDNLAEEIADRLTQHGHDTKAPGFPASVGLGLRQVWRESGYVDNSDENPESGVSDTQYTSSRLLPGTTAAGRAGSRVGRIDNCARAARLDLHKPLSGKGSDLRARILRA